MSPEALRSLIRAAVLAMPMAGCAAAPPPESMASQEAESEADVAPEVAPAVAGSGEPSQRAEGEQSADGDMDPDEFERRWRESTRGSHGAGSGSPLPLELTMPGRPLMIGGRARVATLGVRGAPLTFELGAALSPVARASVASAWASAGQAEHASVASFLRAARELRAVGAPAHLIEGHRRAARQEVAHARDAFAIAAAYGAAATEPRALPDAAPRGGGLLRLARDVFREGCVSETASAFAAERALQRARPRPVRAALSIAAREESSHAALAFRTLRWAASVDPHVCGVIEAELDHERERHRGVVARPSADLRVHGVLGEAAILECRALATERVVAPLLRLT